MIEVQHLTKEFTLNRKQRKESGNYHHRKVTAVNNVSFKCVPGKIFGLIGPNGAGKTTTFYILTGMIKPVSGDVYLDDINTMDYIINKMEREFKLDVTALEINSIVKSYDSFENLSKKHGIGKEAIYVIKGLSR